MRQLTIRVTEPQYESLRRILTHEKAERGARYSMSDLCARLLMLQLSRSVASVPQLDAPSPLGDGTVMPDIPVTKGLGWIHVAPPPVPKLEPTIWPPTAAPQPERLTHATIQSGGASGSQLDKDRGDASFTEPTVLVATAQAEPLVSEGPAADGADPDANESALTYDATEPDEYDRVRERVLEDEGGPDGQN